MLHGDARGPPDGGLLRGSGRLPRQPDPLPQRHVADFLLLLCCGDSAQQPGESTGAYLARRRLDATIALLPSGTAMPKATPAAQLTRLGLAYAQAAAAMGILSAKIERQMRRADVIEVSERSPFYRALFGGIETLHTVVSPSEKYLIVHPEFYLSFHPLMLLLFL